MSELGELYDAWKIAKREKKQSNLMASVEFLEKSGVQFKQLSDTHFRVGPNGECDFWPSTGLYIDNKSGRRSRGIFNLLKRFKLKSESDGEDT